MKFAEGDKPPGPWRRRFAFIPKEVGVKKNDSRSRLWIWFESYEIRSLGKENYEARPVRSRVGWEPFIFNTTPGDY